MRHHCTLLESVAVSHLIIGLAKLLLDILLRSGSKRRESGTVEAMSACLKLRSPE